MTARQSEPQAAQPDGRRWRWPAQLFNGRVRTSTVLLIIAFVAVWWVYDTYRPQPTPPAAPQVVPPGFIPDPAYTWVPRTRVQQPTTTVSETPAPTTETPNPTEPPGEPPTPTPEPGFPFCPPLCPPPAPTPPEPPGQSPPPGSPPAPVTPGVPTPSASPGPATSQPAAP